MIETLQERVNGDETLVRRGRYLTTTFLLEIGSTAWLISIFEGRIVSVTSGPFVMPSSSFALRTSKEPSKVICGAICMATSGHWVSCQFTDRRMVAANAALF